MEKKTAPPENAGAKSAAAYSPKTIAIKERDKVFKSQTLQPTTNPP